MCWALRICYTEKKKRFCLCYVTKFSIFGSENPDLGISMLKLKQELF